MFKFSTHLEERRTNVAVKGLETFDEEVSKCRRKELTWKILRLRIPTRYIQLESPVFDPRPSNAG